MESWGPLFAIIQFLDSIRGHVADWFGPFAPLVTVAGQIMAALLALIWLVAGRGSWAPPIPDLSNYAVRICGLIGLVGVVALYVWSKNGGNAWNFVWVAFAAICAGIVGAILYVVLRQSIFFYCDGDDARYVKGLWLKKYARRVLKNRLDGLPVQYQPRHAGPPPTSAAEYFCKSGKVDDFVWSRFSQGCSLALLLLGYFLLMVPLVITLASASLAVSQPQVEVKQTGGTQTVDLPADVLFDIDSHDIRPGAAATLDKAAAIIRQQAVTSARIEGHTDSTGPKDHNQKLSERRAEAVRRWLIDKAGLVNVRFEIVGYGDTREAASNNTAEGRKQNRRVAIVYSAQPVGTGRAPQPGR